MGKSIPLFMLGLMVLVPGIVLAEGNPGSIDLAKWLDASDTSPRVEGLKPTADLLAFEPGKKPYFYIRFLPSIDVIDGGPNIDHATSGSDRYKDAFGGGYGLNVELWGRFIPNIYIMFQLGATRFDGGRGMTTIDGYDYHLSDMSMTYFTIGGAFAAPITNIYSNTGEIDDLEGLVATVVFCGGAVFTPEVDMYVDSSPITGPDFTGMRLDYWKSRVGFVGLVSIGIEYRVGPFALVADAGVRTFGKPVPATEPTWWSAGQAMVTYPIRFGASYRF